MGKNCVMMLKKAIWKLQKVIHNGGLSRILVCVKVFMVKQDMYHLWKLIMISTIKKTHIVGLCMRRKNTQYVGYYD